jgi:hypothetical protein
MSLNLSYAVGKKKGAEEAKVVLCPCDTHTLKQTVHRGASAMGKLLLVGEFISTSIALPSAYVQGS